MTRESDGRRIREINALIDTIVPVPSWRVVGFDEAIDTAPRNRTRAAPGRGAVRVADPATLTPFPSGGGPRRLHNRRR